MGAFATSARRRSPTPPSAATRPARGCGGIDNANGDTLYARNTILSGNSGEDGSTARDFAGTLDSLGYNLIGNGERRHAGSTPTGRPARTSIRCSARCRTTADRRSPGPACPAARPSTPATTPRPGTTDQRAPRPDRQWHDGHRGVRVPGPAGHGEHDDQPDLLGQPVGLRPVGDLHGHRDVSPGAGTPTGTVTFKDGTTILGTGTLDAAAWPPSAPRRWARAPTRSPPSTAATPTSRQHLHGADPDGQPGEHDDHADLLGQPLGLRPVGDLHGHGAAVSPGAGTPTGTVTFKDGATILGTGTLTGLAS